MKAPALFQGSIHGDEYEGVDAVMAQIERLATTPRGADPVVDPILDHTIVGALVSINPDGRVAGTRANANGFDMNRDYLIQSQPEMQVSTRVMREWNAPIFVDLHGYYTPAMIGGPTKPHSEAVEYDLFLKWNQARLDKTEAAFNAAGYQLQRPINDWCASGSLPGASGCARTGGRPGRTSPRAWTTRRRTSPPSTARSRASTPRPTRPARHDRGVELPRAARRQAPGRDHDRRDAAASRRRARGAAARHARGRAARRRRARRGPACCAAPFDNDHNWMVEYPTAFVIPVGAGQRSRRRGQPARALAAGEPGRGAHADRGRPSFDGQTFAAGSYVVPMKQARRGMAHTALSVGTDISSRISRVYAPPTAWSLGYLWGADTVTIPAGATFAPATAKIARAGAGRRRCRGHG